jgi:hypothetical protein
MKPKQIVLILALSAGAIWAPGVQSAATAQAVSYPWCIQGSILRCYYMSREQCEQTVDYHGFCVANPEYRQGKK